MAQFQYHALRSDGEPTRGKIEGDSARQVRQQLRDQGLMPMQVKPLGSANATTQARGLGGFLQKRLPTGDLALVISQLQTLIEAGMPLAQALKAVSEQAETRASQTFVANLHNRVSEGYSLARALTTSGFQIDPALIATVKAGEESGHLDAVLSRLAEAILQQEKLRKKIKSALIYPTIMVVMSVLIVLFLMVYVVPKVVTVFDNTDQPLPGLTQGLLTLSEAVQAYWLPGLVVLAVLWLVYRRLLRHKRWRWRRDATLLAMPPLRRGLMMANSARWARTLGVLLSSGVTMVEALRIAAEVVTPLPWQAKCVQMAVAVREGQPLHRSMTEAGFFPGLLRNLVQTGEGSGQVATMLNKGADHYEHEVETAAATLVSLVEPIMIMVMGGVVLTIVLAIMLPIFEMNQMVGG